MTVPNRIGTIIVSDSYLSRTWLVTIAELRYQVSPRINATTFFIINESLKLECHLPSQSVRFRAQVNRQIYDKHHLAVKKTDPLRWISLLRCDSYVICGDG